jgi:hypothetical protein
LKRPYLLSLLIMIVTLYGCGAAHVRTEVASNDLHQYDKVHISDVRVYSLEESAKTNEELKAKMDEWKIFARRELEAYINESHYQLVEENQPDNPLLLIVDLDINIAYGNRAMRYWVGFGAGKGGVDSTLIVTDNITGQEKFRAVAESDLAIGGFGGNMEKVLKSNIKKLVDQYPEAP